MTPRRCIHSRCEAVRKPALEELKLRLSEIQIKINQCTHWGLSKETEKTVTTELEAQKIDIKMQMHKLINEM